MYKTITLDVIAICCDFKESTYDEIRSDYSNIFNKERNNEEILADLSNKTFIIWHNDESVLYQQF